ncbi:rab-like protein 2A [Neocloeon triangulifer]|uniref:rab-like protein 2A n=1 Tax=Neocloeon triangulifer TaxID=2078957 RepID=UPI00286F336F|nr:rab-like protein 2A [Neocloeon triangulifer]
MDSLSAEEANLAYLGSEEEAELAVKVICLGDSAVGKSKCVERFLLDAFQPRQLSTYALTLYTHRTVVRGTQVRVDFWDTAGQEQFNNLHPSYFHAAHACVLLFDATRKVTYKNLARWLQELRKYRPHIPVLVGANKIDADPEVTRRSFAFPQRHALPLYFVSASDGTNVVKLFQDAIEAAVEYKRNPADDADRILDELDRL